MLYQFHWIAIIIAPLDWLSVAEDWRKIEYIAKPAIILALLAWLGINDGVGGKMIWFVIGLLFSISDWLIGWNRFVNPIPNRRLITIVTYHIGQFGIIVGTTFHYLA